MTPSQSPLPKPPPAPSSLPQTGDGASSPAQTKTHPGPASQTGKLGKGLLGFWQRHGRAAIAPKPTPRNAARPAAETAATALARRPPVDDLSPQQVVWGWFRAYPGVWLSPLVVGILAGWVLAQPEAALEAPVPESAIDQRASAPLPFVHVEPKPLGPVLPFGPQLQPSALASSAILSQGAPADRGGAQSTEAAPSAQAAGLSTEAQAVAEAQAALEARAQAQAQAFAQAKAAAEAASVPPLPDPGALGDPAVDQLITMQVAIAEGDTTLRMGSSQGGVLMTLAGQPLLQLAAGQYGMQCDGTGLVLNGQQMPATVMFAPVAGGLNQVRDRIYRGRVQFICQGNTVLAVNHIDMQNYLYSVVGSEVSPSWPPAALKAQAVAARSYALTYFFRPAKPHFHIGDTESYQVYKGTVSEDNRVKAAVQATAGEFISYQGGIVESLYAASDEIVMEAFQGGGMSQLGALDFAQQGYNYLQILGYYYPNTSLGRLMSEG